MNPCIEDRQDVGVTEGTGGPGLLLEAAEALGVFSKGRGQNLDRDLATQPCVLGPIDNAHPPRADLRGDLVWAEVSARGDGHVGIFLRIIKDYQHVFGLGD